MHRLITFVLLGVTLLAPEPVRAQGIEKWFFAYVDLLRDPVLDGDATNYTAKELMALFEKLGEHGYTVVVLSSFQLGDKAILDPADQSPTSQRIRKNLVDIQAAARNHGIELIPEVMPVGGSEKILQCAYHLTEATPVKRQRLKLIDAGDGTVLGVASGDNQIRNGRFAGTTERLRSDWIIHKDFESAVTQVPLDQDLNWNGLELDLGKANRIEIGQEGIPLNPRHQYRLSFTLTTCGVGPSNSKEEVHFYAKVRGLDGDRYVPLEAVQFKVKKTQPATRYAVLLSSFHCNEAQLWFGFPQCNTGKAVVSDVRLEEALGPNMIRRQDTEVPNEPAEVLSISVYNETQGKLLDEGQHFDQWRDSEVTANGFAHERKDISIRFKANAVDLNDIVSVNYFHATLPNASPGKICCSLRHSEVFELFEKQVNGIHDLIQPKRWLIDHDEIRAMGHDPLGKGESPSVILAENRVKCIDLINRVDAEGQVILFNDMYDPNHNAVKPTDSRSFFPMVNGDLTDSWNGIDSKITVLNWQTADRPMDKSNLDSWKRSLEHFRKLQSPQVISGFYDVIPDPDHASDSVTERSETIFKAAVEQLNGTERPKVVCYYTTKRNTNFLKEFADAAARVLGD
ncbi:MAG: hypothetical protein JNM43_11245 [Planctomycetaceae bacterium]|nr:hypothetical protein [Planctomycetaceae bacterium]